MSSGDLNIVCVHYYYIFKCTYFDGIGEGEGNGKWQSLGHGDHQHRDTNDEELDQHLCVGRRPIFFVYHESGNGEADHQDHYGERGDRRTWKTKNIDA